MELFERDELLAALDLRLRRTAGGDGCLLVVGGEAGVGKTALLRRFCDVAARSARVLQGACDPLSTPRALGPLFDLAIPTVQRLLSENASRDLLFRTLLANLTESSRPTVLTIEDVHWADEATFDLLRYLGRRIASTRALVIATYRDDEVGPRHGLRRVLGELATVDAVQRLTVSPLSLEAVSQLAATSTLEPHELFERTRGNPFFVTEILAAGGEIPPTIHDAVLARAARLPPAAWEVLEAAAVIGSTLAFDLLERVAAPSGSDLEACLECGMLHIEGDALAFRHELAREAILGAIAPPRTMALHAAVLRALELLPDERRDRAHLAHHAEGAGDRAAVLHHAPAAAGRAMRLRAYREAADQYGRALRFAASLPPAERARLLEARSYACYLTAQIDQAITAREEALATWIALGDRQKEGENRCHLAILYWADARAEDATREAVAAAVILETLPLGPELAMAYGTLARLRGTILDDAEAIAWGERAIALAERFEATETLVDALITVGVARLARGSFAPGRAELERSAELAISAGLDDLVARAYANLGFGYDEHYRFAEAARHYQRGIEFCRERDLDNSRQHMTAWLARCQLFLGHWADASMLARSLLAAPDVAPVTQFVAFLVEGMVKTRRGDLGAGPMLDEALALATASGSLYRLGPVRAARAEAAFLSGDRASALAEARADYDLAVRHKQGWYIGELAYWRWKGGEDVDLPEAIAEPFAWQIAGDWWRAAVAWDALGCPYEAARARAEGDDEAALRVALAAFDALGARPAAALVRRRLRAIGARRVPRGPRPSTRANPAGLTARELDILALLASGNSTQEMAGRLFLSARTVENHVAAILAKLGATTRTEAVAAATQAGIIPKSE
jgi:DNA-binding CsgD family transcriptional regulator